MYLSAGKDIVLKQLNLSFIFCFELLLKVLEFYMHDNFYVQIKNEHALWLLKARQEFCILNSI
jgi:hypothetical protein